MAQRACHAILHSRHIVHGHQEARQGIRGCCDASLYTSGTSNIKVSFKEDSLQPDSKLVSGSHTLGRVCATEIYLETTTYRCLQHELTLEPESTCHQSTTDLASSPGTGLELCSALSSIVCLKLV